MKLTDTHAHLEGFERRGELEGVLSRARGAGIERIVACSTSPGDWAAYSKISERHSEISWMAGIHPTDITDSSDDALDALPSLFISGGKSDPIGIGEIGLDYYRLPADPEEAENIKTRQRRIFSRQLRIAADLGLKVCVHARNALEDCIAEMEKARFNFSNAVFHCFSGTPLQVAELNRLGARASFTGIITYKNAGQMRGSMLKQGLGYLMLETDCPYLAPVPYRGKACEPFMLSQTAKAAAEIFGVSEDYIARATSQNARDFFGFDRKL